MPKPLMRCVVFAVAGCLLVAQPLTAAESVPGHLVDVRWLAQHLGDPDVVILDASPASIYAAQHIPGAVNADVMTYGGHDPSVRRSGSTRRGASAPGRRWCCMTRAAHSWPPGSSSRSTITAFRRRT